MIPIILVDDEILALEYLKSMVDWELHGYRIVGCATSGRRALELYNKTLPKIVISDIRMPGIDGLELSRRLKEQNPDIVIILLSAYKDFAYAQKGIQYGVSNYLLKHELCEEKLLRELSRIKEQLKKENRREKIYQKYFMNQLIYNQAAIEELGDVKLGNRLFLLLLHKRNYMVCGEFVEEEWNEQECEAIAGTLEEELDNKIFYVADVQITSNNRMVLYRIENTPSRSTINNLIEQKSAQIGQRLLQLPNCHFNVIYSGEITKEEISITFRWMSRQVRYAVFWKQNKQYPMQKMEAEETSIWGEEIRKLRSAMYESEQTPETLVRGLLEKMYRESHIESCKSLITLLNNLIQELEKKEGVYRDEEGRKRYTFEEVIQYYTESISSLHEQICCREQQKYSRMVSEIIRYIGKNYKKELSLDLLGEEFQMNGVYLGQIFKKEVGVTFLKYLTNLRMEEAKRLLREKNCTVSETARLVGYQTSQYFSQIFGKNVGMRPQEYKNRRWKEEK